MTKKTKGVIAAGHEKTAQAGIEILNQGGNAFDAAIASIFAAFVVEPMLTSIGGSGFLLAHTSKGENILFDFFCQTPLQKKPISQLDFYPVNVNFGDKETQKFHIGKASIAVPGNLAGILAIHQKLGKLPLKIIAEPAINYAKNGVEVNKFQGFCLEILKPILTEKPEGKKIYAPQGNLLKQGDTYTIPELGDTLTYLVDQGIEEFYQGEIAQQIAKEMKQGGYLTLEDLQKYQVILRKPLSINYRGYELLTNPPPSSGGALIAFSLKLLSTVNLDQIKWRSKQHLEILAQIMSLTNEARKDGYDAHIYRQDIIEEFLGEKHFKSYQNQLINTINKLGSTTHISVLDEEGNGASVTTSNGEGSSCFIPHTGIMLNNMLGEEDLNPLGFHQWQCNQRISSMMAPTMVLKNGKPEIVLGSGGSNRIRTAIFQVISNLIDFNLPINEAINLPRVHWENKTFSIEPNITEIFPENLQLPSETKMSLWKEQNMFFGGVHGIKTLNQTVMEGAGDLRRCGVVLAN
jgi:gamma-glutamyltranspeptidase / glutathione hydrolase